MQANTQHTQHTTLSTLQCKSGKMDFSGICLTYFHTTPDLRSPALLSPMSMSNPLTDPRSREEDFLEHSQQQLLKAIAEEQEKLKKKDEVRNVEAKTDKDEDSPSSQLPS